MAGHLQEVKLSDKIGRNEPCPCGSGKKYKRCCLNKKVAVNKKYLRNKIVSSGLPGRLALTRYKEDLENNPDILEEFDKRVNKYKPGFKNFILNIWGIKNIRKLTTREIIEKLKSMNVDFNPEHFKEQTQNYISAIQLSEKHYYTQNFNAEKTDEDFIWLAIIELWNRLAPEQYNIEMIDYSMQDGYEYMQNENYKDGLAQWEKAWNVIKTVIPPHIKSVTEADDFIPQPLTQSIYNWCQDFEMELGNAGTREKSYFAKRIEYCNEFCCIFPLTDDLIMQNMLRAKAESYAKLGDIETAEKLFQSLIEKFPQSIWGYIGWSDMCCEDKIPPDYNKAEEILKMGLTRCDKDTNIISERIEDLKKIAYK